MSNIRLFEPLSNDFFNDFFKSFMRPMRFEFAAPLPDIKLEVSEKDNAYVVKAEVPGMRKEDIKVKVDRNHVWISAESKKEKSESAGGKMLRSEIYYGAASREFDLDSDVDAEQSKASYKDGILELTLPKAASSAARTLAVQ